MLSMLTAIHFSMFVGPPHMKALYTQSPFPTPSYAPVYTVVTMAYNLIMQFKALKALKTYFLSVLLWVMGSYIKKKKMLL